MASKKKGLPFVVQPRLQPITERIGTEESGVIEIERKGYLTVAEKTIVDQASSDMSEANEMLEAVRVIAVAEKRPVAEIFEELQDTEKSGDLLQKYAAQIATASASAQNQQRKIEIIATTALIICRIDPRWTVEQSMDLHPDLLAGLYALYQDEDKRSLEAFEAAGPANNTKK